MAKKKTQYKVLSIIASDLVFSKEDGMYIIKVSNIIADKLLKPVDRVMKSSFIGMSSSRLFETLGARVEENEEGVVVNRYIDDATVITFDVKLSPDPKVRERDILRYTTRFRRILKQGFRVYKEDGTFVDMKRGIRSASQSRVGKAYFIKADRAKQVVREVSYNALFLDEFEPVNIAKLQARLGLSTSNSIRLSTPLAITDFNVLPDHEVTRETKTIEVGSEEVGGKKRLVVTTAKTKEFKWAYADGQGTALPSYFAKVSHELGLINDFELRLVLRYLKLYNEDIITMKKEFVNEDFWLAFNKIPQAMQVRFALCKGLLFMFPHNLPQYRQDCNKKKYRKDGLVMKFMKLAKKLNKDKAYEYNFDAPICFTDSMWKENIDPKAFSNRNVSLRPHMEVVLVSGKEKTKTYMGYQYWGALGDKVDIVAKSKAILENLKTTVFTNAADALAFVGAFATNDDIENGELLGDDESLEEVRSKTEKLVMVLTLRPDCMGDRWVQDTLKQLIMRSLERMRDDGRVPVEGSNPYIIADPMPMFGLEPVLKAKQYYYNGRVQKAGGFRSPLVDESEAVVLNLVDVPEFDGLFKDILVFNWFDDTLTRMGGADCDGDKIALIFDKDIIKHIKGAKLPMVTDMSAVAKKDVMDEKGIAQYDLMTILPEAGDGMKVYTIGEITELGTAWSDVAKNPRVLKLMGITKEQALANVRALRGMQGISIDFAKTGINVPMDEKLLISCAPAWKKKVAIDKDMYRVKKVDGEKQKELEIYVSESPMQKNWDYMNEVIKDLGTYVTPNTDNNGYTFRTVIEDSGIVDPNEFDELIEIVMDIEDNYRKALSQAGALSDDEERMAHVAYVTEIYTARVESLPYTPATVASAAYNVCYNASASNGKSLSFVWNCCFPGLLQLLEENVDGVMNFPLPSHIPATRIPETVTVVDGIIEIPYTTSDDKEKSYKIKANTPNGDYEVIEFAGRKCIKVIARKTADQRLAEIQSRRANYIGKMVDFTLVGFKYTDYTVLEFMDALIANEGVLTIVDGKRNGKKSSLNVLINDEKYAIVSESFISNIKPFLDGATDFSILNYTDISATYIKKNKETGEVENAYAHRAAIQMVGTLVGDLPDPTKKEEKKDKKSSKSTDAPVDYTDYMEAPPADYGDTGVPYYGEEYYAPQEDVVADVEVDVEVDVEEDNALDVELLSPAYEEIFKPRAVYNKDASNIYSRIEGFFIEVDGNNIKLSADINLSTGLDTIEFNLVKSGRKLSFVDNKEVAYQNGNEMKLGELFVNAAMQMTRYALSK